MLKSKDAKNKFSELTKEELLRAVLEQEAELEIYRPKPAKFRMGQLLAFTGSKNNAWFPGQPAVYFSVLSLENRNGLWHYGHSRNSQHVFSTYPESKCRALTATEIDGSVSAEQPAPVATEVTAGPLGYNVPAGGLAGLGSGQAIAQAHHLWTHDDSITEMPPDDHSY